MLSRRRIRIAALVAAVFFAAAGAWGAGEAVPSGGAKAPPSAAEAKASTPARAEPASAPASRPAAATTAPGKPVAPAPMPDKQAAPRPATPKAEPANVRFHFDGENYRDVVKFIARVMDKPLLADDLRQLIGQLTYFDATPYTKTEAMAIVNQIIRMKGFTLMDAGRYLKLVPLSKVPQQSDLPVVRNGLDTTPRRPEEEIVTAILPVQYIDAGQAVSVVARMVHSFGSLSILGKGKGIIITDTVANIRRIQQLLSIIDKGTLAESQLTYYPLKVAPAGDVAKLVDQLFNAQRGQRQYIYNPATRRREPVPVDPTEAVTVTSDARSNTVVVIASSKKHQMIREMIERIDVAQPAGEGGIQIVELKNAKAADLAKTLTAAVGGKSIVTVDRRNRRITEQIPSARIVPDDATNSLVISAEPEVMKQLQAMIEQLDAAAVQGAGVRIFPLKVANAASLVGVVQNTFGTRDGRGRQVQDFAVTADSRTNSLIVKGPAADMEAVAKLIKELDSKTATEREIHVVHLPAGSARELASAITRLLGQARGRRGAQDDTIRVEADGGTNSLIISAAPGDWQRIKSMLDDLTKEAPQVVASTRIFAVKHAKAAELAPVFQRLFDPRGRGRSQRGATPAIPVVITHDAQSNTLVVSASGENLTEIERLLSTLDVPAQDGAKVMIRSYALSNASAAALARSLGRLFAQERRGRTPPTEPQPRFEAEQDSNQLVVAATAEQFETIDKLIQTVQTEAGASATVLKHFALKHAQAEQLAPILERVVQAEVAAAQRSGAARGRRSDFQVSADGRTNVLVITAPTETMAIIDKLMPSLDIPDSTVQTTKVIELTNADPDELAGALNAALAGQPAQPPRGRGRGRMPVSVSGLKGKKVLIVPASSARALLLTGEKDDVAFAEELIKTIDQRPSTDRQTVKTFPVKHGKAEDLAIVLNSTVGQMQRGGRGGGVPTRISADKNANALVVSAPGDIVEKIGELLKELDVEGAQAGAVTIEIVKLKNAKAELMATALNSAQGQDPRRRGGRRDQGEEDVVRVTADEASNSLLLTGRPAQIEETKKLIAKLDDEAAAAETVTELVELENADPDEVAGAINAALTGQSTSRRGRGQTVDVSGLVGRKVMAVPARAARTVLLSGKKEDVAFAAELVRKIDQRPSTDKQTVKTFPVKHGKAEDLAIVLNSTVGQMRRGGRGGGVPTRISADKNANALVVSAPGDIVEKIGELLKELDVEGAQAGAVAIEIVKLKNAKAGLMATALNSAQGQDPRRRGGRRGQGEEDVVRVTADEASNSLLLSGRPVQIEETKKLIAQLDTTSAELSSEMRIFQLSQAKASELAPVLERILVGQVRGRGRRGDAGADIRIASQDKANAVVVQAPPEAMALAEQIVKQFDGEAGGETVIQIVKLGNADAFGLAEAVNQVLAEQASGGRRGQTPAGTGAVVVPEGNSNSVLVRGNRLEVEKAVQLIKQLDAGGSGVGAQVRVFPLKRAEAATVAKTIDVLFRQILTQQRRRGGSRASAGGELFSIAADERTNSVIVSASAANFATLEPLLERLDTDAEATIREVRYIPLLRADALELTDKIEAMFADRKKGDRPTVTADELSNGITAIARDADFRAIEAVVAKWDEAAEANYIQVRFIPLTGSVQAEKLAEALKRVYEQVSGTPVRVTDKLPKPAPGGELFMLPAPADPDAAEGAAPVPPATQPARGDRPPAKPPSDPAGQSKVPAPPTGPPVVIAVDKESNSLIVSAGRKEMEEIDNLIYALTSGADTAEAELKVFKVKIADPASIAKTLNALFNPKPVAAAKAKAKAQAQRGKQQAPVQAPTPKPTVTIVADVRTRSVIVRAKPVELDLIGALIEQLDTASVVISEVRIFTLRNTDAAEVVQNLRQLFSLELPAAARGAAPKGRNQQQVRQMLEMQKAKGAAPVDASGGITVSANRMTNSVIVAASSDAMELVAKLIEELDQAPAAGATAVRMFKIEHAEVSEVAEAVSRIFSRPARGGRGAAGRTQAATGAVVAGNESARMVIVSARVDELPLIEQVIKDLDSAGAGESAVVKVYRLQAGDARSVAEALNRTLLQSVQQGRRARPAAGAGGLRISPETGSNAVVVRASDADHQRIAKLITELDQPAGGQARFQTIKLTRADARQVAGALNSMLRAWPRKRNEPRPVAAFDTKTNTLMVSAADKDMEAVEKMVAQLEAGKKEPVELRLIPLSSARAVEVARALGVFYGPRASASADPDDRSVTVAADDRTNALLVSARADQFQVIAAMIKKLDEAGAEETGVVKVYRLEKGDANSVAAALTRTFAQAARAGGRSAAEQIYVSAEPGSNAVVVRAPAEEHQQIAQLVAEMDEGSQQNEAGYRTIKLVRTNGPDVVNALNRTLGSWPRKRNEPRPTVSCDPATNTLIVSGTEKHMEIVTRMVKDLESGPAEKVEVRFVPLANAGASELARALGAFYGPRAAAGTDPANRGVTITADDRSNTLLVSAKPEQFAAITTLIQKLDEAGSEKQGVVKVYRLEKGDAASVAAALTRTLAQSARGRGQAPGEQISVSAEPASNAVVVRAAEADHKQVAKLILEMDVESQQGEATFRTIKLARADAREVVNALNRMLWSWPRKPNEPRPTVAFDTNSNTLMVSGTDKHMALVEKMVAQLETGAEAKTQVQLIALTDASAVDVARALGAFYGPRASGAADPADRAVTITADERTNVLIVAARPEQFQAITALIGRLDVAGAAGDQRRVVIPLTQASAQDVARAVTQVFAPGRGQRVRPEDLVTAAAEVSSNTVVVSASEKNLQKVQDLVKKLDTAGTVGAAKQVVLPLVHASAADAARAITQAFAPKSGQRVRPQDLVTAAAEPATNTLIVSASEENLEKIRTLVKQLDTQTVGGRTMEFMILANAKAPDVARVMSQVVRQAQRRGGEQPPVVSADASSNALVMSGKKSDLDALMAMAKQLDQAAVGKAVDVHILPLKNADAVEVAEIVSRLKREEYNYARRAGKSVEPVAVSADERANALIVAASEEEFQKVSKLVNQIDEMSPSRPNLRLIQLENADPQDVLKAIEQIFGSGGGSRVTRGSGANGRVTRRGARGGRPGAPEATVLSGQRALLVNASEEDWEVIQRIVKALDKAAESAKQQVLVFPLVKAPNTRVAQALNAMYRAAARKDRPEDVVSVTPLPGTNALVVTAAKEKMEEVGALIRQLDGVEIAGEMQFRLFALKNASATKILPALQIMIRPIEQARPNQPINLTADQRANAIIVSTQAPVLDQIEKIINTLDAVPPFKTADILIVPLKNADAASLAQVLTDMLTPGTTTVITPEARALQEQIRLLRLQQGREGLGPLDLTKPIKITSDPVRRGLPGSNTLIISSTPENLSAMSEIVKLLDTLPIAEAVRVQIIHLRNSDAISVMQLLREIFTQGRQLAGRPGTPTAGRATPETTSGVALTGGLNVTADARTNSLVIAGTEEALALAALLVQDLDRQPAGEFTEVRVFKLAHADAAKLAALIEQVFAEQPAAAPGVSGARTYVTRLRVLREKDRPVAAKIARSHPTLVVRAETNANLLIVAARSDLLGIVSELVKQTDVSGAGSLNIVRIYPLANADASRMAGVIQGLYAGPNASLIRLEDRPTITVDTRTNSLVVSSSEKTYTVVDALLNKLDAKLPIDLRDIRLVPLANADATALAQTLQRMMDARVQRQQSLGVKDAEAMRMIIVPDARSNYLIVGGSAEGFKLVEDLAKRLDEAAPALGGQIQLIALKNANAGTLGAMLTNLFNQRYAAARTPDVQRQKPVILPDLRTNMLMVAANQDDSEVIRSLVAKLDAAPPDPAVELVVIGMKFNDAGMVGPMVQRIFADRLQAMTPPGQQVAPQDVVSVATDALSNALVISASKENLAMIRDLLAKVDVAPPTETGVVRMYPLKHADVSRVAGVLQALVQQGLYKPGLIGAADNAIARAREKVSITTDTRTNVLIVSASKENFAVIDEILRRVDVAEGWGLAGNVKVYILKHADAAKLGPMLQQMFDRKRQAEAAVTPGTPPRTLPAVVVPDPRTNALLVAASKEAFAELDGLIARLDVGQPEQTYDFAVHYLKRASAAALEPVLRQLLTQRAAGRPQATPVTVIADPKVNALIIGGEKDDLVVAGGLIERLDEAAPPAGKIVQAFPIAKADAAQLANTLLQLYDATKPTGGISGIAVTVDERSNTVLVSAAADDMKTVADLIKKLDTAVMTDVTEIRIFTLRHADAAQLASILTEALTNKPKPMTAVSPNRATLLRLVAESPDGRKLATSALKEGIMVTAVPRTNSLLVQGPVEAMPLLARLIQALDETHPRMAEIRVFTLTNADATQMARILSELFQLQAAATQRQAARYTLATTRPASQAPAATLGSAEQSALTITVDRRTNSLLVGGTREYVGLVERVIQELDASPAEDRQTVVYRLRNAQSTDIETALRQFLDQERQRVVSTLGADAVGAAKELLAREVAIVAEQASNTLLISGSPRFFKTVAAMVRELDQPPPQVLVQVLLAEVTLDDTTEFGFEWNVSATPSGRNVSFGPKLGLKSDAFTFSVTSGDLSLLLRALQTQGRLEVLSRPQIRAVDNQEARINIGQQVPFVTAARITEGGDIISTIAWQDVGIILSVTPRISPDGFVKMEVNPEVSSLSDSSVEISENLNAIIINRRFAQTTVTVQDGHTVVIGGLITNKLQNREEKVPLLGDIPLLGLLFKSNKVIKERTELLIMLTPRILRTPTDGDVLSNKQIRSLGLAKSIHTDSAIGELLNPLRGVTPLEVKRLEAGEPGDQRDNAAPVVIPLTLPPRKVEQPSAKQGEDRK